MFDIGATLIGDPGDLIDLVSRQRSTSKEGRGVLFLQQSDVRIKNMARKTGFFIIFNIDAWESIITLNKMNAAAMSLLIEAYQSHDQICFPFKEK
jgi:Mg-chelatase subunit ChlD